MTGKEEKRNIKTYAALVFVLVFLFALTLMYLVNQEQEQEENQRCLQELMRMLQQSDAQESEVRTFIREIRQYATIQELDETVLNRLISRILVGEVKKVDGQKVQEVRIVYNFVGEIFM